jgi:hypothetical protein
MSSVLAALWRPEHPCGCPHPSSEPEAPECGEGAPPCTFRRTPKRNGADCPAGGSSLIITGLRSWWNAKRIGSGSGARNSPGTVVKATAWAHSIQIGHRRADSMIEDDRTGRTRRPAPFILPWSCPAVRRQGQSRFSQSRSRPRLASSRRIASPVPGPKAG